MTNLAPVEREFGLLVDRLDELKRAASQACLARQAEILAVKTQIVEAQNQLQIVEKDLDQKLEKKSADISKIHDDLIFAQIGVPQRQLDVFWDQLRVKVEPASFGGVKVTIGFPVKLPCLVFVLRYHDFGYQVADCDPLIIGLADLVDQLNNDNKSGALARFICRIRARYTAQYSEGCW